MKSLIRRYSFTKCLATLAADSKKMSPDSKMSEEKMRKHVLCKRRENLPMNFWHENIASCARKRERKKKNDASGRHTISSLAQLLRWSIDLVFSTSFQGRGKANPSLSDEFSCQPNDDNESIKRQKHAENEERKFICFFICGYRSRPNMSRFPSTFSCDLFVQMKNIEINIMFDAEKRMKWNELAERSLSLGLSEDTHSLVRSCTNFSVVVTRRWWIIAVCHFLCVSPLVALLLFWLCLMDDDKC